MNVKNFKYEKYIDVTHRVSTKPDASIIIRFRSRSHRDDFYSYRFNLKGKKGHHLHIFDGDNEVQINPEKIKNDKTPYLFVNELLTPYKKELFWKAKE